MISRSADFVRLALTLSFLSGLIMLVLGWLRLGTLMNFVSHTVVVGLRLDGLTAPGLAAGACKRP